MRRIFMMVILGLFLPATIFAQQMEQAESVKSMKAKAMEAAQQWLALVDEEKYVESWQEAAAYFKNAVPQEAWKLAINNVRPPLGKLVSRELVSADYHTSLPGAPDGHYVVIVFKTSFEHKAEALETITPMEEKDGTWRVSGYYIN